MPITMPGLASNIHTDEMVKKLVEVEKQPIVRLQRDKKLLNLQEKIWKSFKGELKTFDNILKKLYSFNRVFKEKSIDGDIKDYFSAIATPRAENTDHTIKIVQLAKAEKIITDSIDVNKILPPAKFLLKIGDRTKKLNFKGGSIKKFSRYIKENASDLIKVDFVKIDSKHYKMSVESKFTGKDNNINMIPDSSAAKELFNELGLIQQPEAADSFYENFNKKDKTELTYFDDGYNSSPSLFVKPHSNLKYNLDKIFLLKNCGIQFVYNMVLHKPDVQPADIDNNNLLKKDIGSVTIKDITIDSASEILNLESNKQTNMKNVSPEGDIYIVIYSADNKETKITLTTVSNWSQIDNKITDLKDIKFIKFVNNSNMDLYVDDLKIINKSDELVYKNEVQKPQNAKLLIDDIPIEREKNSDLKDIIDGVTFNLKKETPNKIRFKINPDKEKIKKKVKEFVDQYNNILEFISIVSKTSSSTKPGESDKKKQERGALSNDISLMNIKSKLRSTVIDRYDTSLGDDLSILAQIGISTGEWGSSWENIRKGFLQLNESKFDLSLDKWGDKVGEIFGYDSNQDNIIDTGVAYKLSVDIKPFIQLRGIIDGKINFAKTLVKTKDKIIADKEDRLNMYRNKLKSKFTTMEESLSKLNAKSQALQNQLNNLSGGNKSEK